jgi:hypothetical protein
LLRYVPDDAFIARFRAVPPAALRAEPAVRWFGEYRPDYRVATRLRELAAAGQDADVSLALSPGATPEERIALRRSLQRFARETPTRFGAILRGRVTPTQLAVLSRSPIVLWIEPAPDPKLFDEIASKIVGGGAYTTGEPGDDFPGIGGGEDGEEDDDGLGGLAGVGGLPGLVRPLPQVQGLPAAEHQTTTQQLGFDGRGVTVAVADSGLHNGDAESMHPDLAGRVDAFFYYGRLEDASDEHSHGTHVTGIVAGNGATGETDEFGNLYGLGVAPGAHIVAQRIFDGIGNYEAPPTYETLTRDATRAGAVIASNSWGDDTQGRYDLSAAEFDALVRDADELTPGDQPYIMEFSAGNAGPGSQTIGSPAVAKNVIASGASQNDRYGFYLFEDGPEAMADFSSRGPCEDGRIKPDVVAPGTWIASLQSESATDENAWTPISANYQYQGGTSQSGPHVSGAAAVFVQFWRETQGGLTPSPALVKAALINSAVDLDDELGGTEPIPNHDEGWGRVTLTNLIGSSRKFEYVDQSVALTNLQVHERRVLVGHPREPLKVTLTYTDVPGLPAAVPALVNNLDLEVVGPDGTLYRGNAFALGESIPNALSADFLNNVEGVHLLAPIPGEYIVRVRATRVVEDIHQRPGVNPVQDFALFVSADIPLPGQGILVLDRLAYTAPAAIGIRLIDFDLRGADGVDILLTSETESAGEPLVLRPFGTAGVFTGLVATATAPAVRDGRLQIAHGDTIRARYADASPAGERFGTAAADLVPPVIGAVEAATRFGRLLVYWETDEDADAIVEFGTSATLGRSLTNRTLATEHELALDGFAAQNTVFYRVRSRDAAGNESVRDNAGQPFQVVVQAAATVLLVNQFASDIILGDWVTLNGYTDALDALGVDYDVWDVDAEPRPPKFEELRNYPVVIWRVAEFVAALGTQDIKAIRDYVDAGGALFMASMELLTRLDEGGFASFRRGVLHVEDDFDVDPGLGGIFGSDSISMTSGVDTPLDFSEYPDLFIIPQDLSDTFRPTTNAAPILFDSATGRAVGVRYPRTGEDGRGRVVFFSFPFDTIPMDGDSPNNRVEILRRVLGFLAPASTGVPTLELDREEYSLPAVVAIEVADPSALARSSLPVSVRTDLEPSPQSLELAPSGQPGRFRGLLRLAPESVAPAAGQVRARDGDLLTVTYDGGALAGSVQVAAVVDTGLPEIRDVVVEPEYTEAIVRWTTSEPTDGLAKYQDLGFPSNFTSYHADYLEEHELRLTGLEPDRDYEFAIVCRDPAGNTATDDNAGKFHRFRTLKPLAPPFVDDLERGATNWTVAGGELDAETLSLLVSSTWELGRPANELATAAHSGSACWATNLRGDVNDYSESSLVSPAILLSGGNRATLRFWHNYDFFPRSDELDIIEIGGLYVTTNNGAAWTPLVEYGEASDGWEQEEIDLSAYLGKTIRLGWAYGLLSLGSVEHPGWLVDDIALSVDSYVPGTLILSNNLHQASVALRGPVSRTERGRLTVLTNLPPGDYTFEYAAVPFLQAPPTAAHTLVGGATLVVSGAYTFPDTNADGVSDLWEERYLGGIRPGHRPDDDADADGFPDLAEFLAGTNPTNATSRLLLLAPQTTATGDLVLRWESAAGRGYRVHGTADAVRWEPVGDWQRAASSASSATVPGPPNGLPYLFRLEAQP